MSKAEHSENPSNWHLSWNVDNSLWPSDALWCYRPWSPFLQVMASSLMASCIDLNQYWLIANGALGHSPKTGFIGEKCSIVILRWQLTVLPQSGGNEFNPRWVQDNLSVPLRVYMRFPVPEHQNHTNKYDSDTEWSVMEGILLLAMVNLPVSFILRRLYRSSLLCLHRCELSIYRYQLSFAVFVEKHI